MKGRFFAYRGKISEKSPIKTQFSCELLFHQLAQFANLEAGGVGVTPGPSCVKYIHKPAPEKNVLLVLVNATVKDDRKFTDYAAKASALGFLSRNMIARYWQKAKQTTHMNIVRQESHLTWYEVWGLVNS